MPRKNTLCVSKKTKNVIDSEIFEFSGFREKEMLRYPLGNKMLKPQSNGVGSMPAAARSVLCSNETLPATQLLKLMDAGMSTKVSRKVDKNMEFTNQPSFPHISHHSGIFPLNGVTHGNLLNSSGQIRDSSADHRGGRSSEYFTLVPISDAFAFPSKRDKNCVRRSHILGQVSQKMVNDRLKSKGMKRRKHSDYPTVVQNADASACTICGSRNSDVNTSVDVIGSEICPLAHDHMKEKICYHLKLGENDVDETMKEPIYSKMKVAQVINGEFHKGAEAINLNLENHYLSNLVIEIVKVEKCIKSRFFLADMGNGAEGLNRSCNG
ncbi:hypothetical protein RHMOL_Rhmol08G0298800 [Rhododendron molle]|uniref:Uncharacterized protein n=1 Tax=Rhododendron molle TaxID=49168 RepID=A0ACC0MV58_RHOML|nr:hypothetical protein RHMOL_Rhmol08G0298800 [Rhododendron molle]